MENYFVWHTPIQLLCGPHEHSRFPRVPTEKPRANEAGDDDDARAGGASAALCARSVHAHLVAAAVASALRSTGL